MGYLFAKGYRNDPKLRQSFNRLSETVFGINFESWFEKGYWTDKYIPFSFVVEGRVVANVSVNEIGLVIGGERKRGLQLGTVMTHPVYRGKGLSRKLMEIVLKEYEESYDLMYLFANGSVLDFYPKFGFKKADEHIFWLDISELERKAGAIRQLDMENVRDREFLYRFAEGRRPVSNLFATFATVELLLFYALYVFGDSIYYLEDKDCVAIFQHTDGVLHLFDLITRAESDVMEILPFLAGESSKAVFHFTPGEHPGKFNWERHDENEAFFIRAADGLVLPEMFKHPLTSKA